MTAVHLQTAGMHCPACPPRIEAIVDQLPGVSRVVACRDLALTSVMFDENVVDVATIREQISSAGFHTQLLNRRSLS